MTPLEALQATLAGEHAAVYVYGVLGGRVSASAQASLADRVRAAYTVHRGRRDQLITMVRAEDEQPVVSEVSYQLPNAATTVDALTAAALVLEQRSTAKYADMVGSTSGAARQWAIDALHDAAVRQLGFGGRAEPFPGIAEL